MSRTKKIYLSKEELEECFIQNAEIQGRKCLNEKTNQYRYFLYYEEKEIRLDVYFRKDKTITIQTVGRDDEKKTAEKLKKEVIEKDKNPLFRRCFFKCKIDERVFLKLREELKGISNINKIKDEEKDIEYFFQIILNHGEKITLKYYKTKKTFTFQGDMMELYSKIRVFLNPFIENSKKGTGLKFDNMDDQKRYNDLTERIIESKMPNVFKKLSKFMQELVKDSISLMDIPIELNDYAIICMPSLKTLEGRIKQMFMNVNIKIEDKGMFVRDKGRKKYIFNYVKSKQQYLISEEFMEYIFDNLTQNDIQLISTQKSIIEECYNYYYRNRHGMFHLNSITETSRKIPNKEIACRINYDVYDLLEKSAI